LLYRASLSSNLLNKVSSFALLCITLLQSIKQSPCLLTSTGLSYIQACHTYKSCSEGWPGSHIAHIHTTDDCTHVSRMPLRLNSPQLHHMLRVLANPFTHDMFCLSSNNPANLSTNNPGLLPSNKFTLIPPRTSSLLTSTLAPFFSQVESCHTLFSQVESHTFFTDSFGDSHTFFTHFFHVTLFSQVETCQVCIVAWLAGRAATGLDPSAREDALLTFLRGLVLRNRGATRDVPPPGLSGVCVCVLVCVCVCVCVYVCVCVRC